MSRPRTRALALSLPLVVVTFFWALLAGAPPARAGSDPARTWWTLETEHFAIHYYDDGEAFARRVASLAEEAFDRVGAALAWAPEEVVHITCTDDGDSANGFASVLPHNDITLFAHPPGMDSALSDHDDWLRMLVFHEYAHIAHLDHVAGLPAFLNRIFGKSYIPAQAMPRWMTEGIATWIESTLTGGGRIGSSRFEMYLRTATLADRLPSLSQLTGSPLQPPRGTSWYLYGSYFIDYVARHAGDQAIRDYIASHGRQLIPYGLNIESRRATGLDLVEWSERLHGELRERALATDERVSREGLREGVPITRGGERKDFPRFTPDGRHLLWVHGTGHEPTHLVWTPAASLSADTEPTLLLRCDGGCGRFDISRDSGTLLYTSGRPHRRYSHYDELIRSPLRPDLPRLSGRQLTRAGRVDAPGLSPRGDRLWVVRTSWGETWLEAIDPRTGERLDRWDPPLGARVDGTAPHPDGRRLYTSMHSRGSRDLIEVDLETRGFRRLTSGAALEVDPALTTDGRWLLYASDASGVYDLYALPIAPRAGSQAGTGPPGPARKLTTVLSGALSPTTSPDGTTLIYKGWTVDGWELYRLPFAPLAAPAVVDADPTPLRLAPALRRVDVVGPRPFRPMSTMLPRSWLPSLSASTAGGSRIGLTLSGRDASGRLGATFAADWDSGREDTSLLASLRVGTSWPDLSLSLARYSWDRTSFVADRTDPYREEVTYLSAKASLPFPDPAVGLSTDIGYSVELLRAAETKGRAHSPDETQARIPFEGLTGSLRLAFRFDDVARHAFSISPQRGLRGGGSLRIEDPALGSRFAAWGLRGGLHGYIPIVARWDHVLALSARAGWSGGAKAGRTEYSVGGPPEQDIVSDLISDTRAGRAWLRGYPEGLMQGWAYQLWTAEYRLPLWRLRAGVETLPLFARDLVVALFSDAGLAWREPLGAGDLRRVKAGVGAEVRLSADLLQGLSARFRLGYAHGFGPEGTDQVYLLLASDP